MNKALFSIPRSQKENKQDKIRMKSIIPVLNT
jgi:hypothetical protein